MRDVDDCKYSYEKVGIEEYGYEIHECGEVGVAESLEVDNKAEALTVEAFADDRVQNDGDGEED